MNVYTIDIITILVELPQHSTHQPTNRNIKIIGNQHWYDKMQLSKFCHPVIALCLTTIHKMSQFIRSEAKNGN